MARSPIPSMHVHDRAEIAHDARRIDALTAAVAPALAPFARAAALRVTAEALAEDFVTPAAAALTQLLAEGDHEALGQATRRAHASLADALRDALPPVEPAEILERARSLAQLAVTAWSATLHDALAETRHVSLVDGVYADEHAREHLVAIATTEGVDDPVAMFRAVRDAIFEGGEVALLPGRLHLEVVARGRDGAMHVAAMRQADASDPASSEVVQSGERVRDARGDSPSDSVNVKKAR
ncbi:MAG: hypothetical protein WCJ30_25420 [Deltaproteobacteria bacterium]